MLLSRWCRTVLVVVLACTVWPAAAVDKSKFRTCAQSAFCRRYQKFVKHVDKNGHCFHKLDSASLERLGGNAVRARVLHGVGVDANGTIVVPALRLDVAFFLDDVSDRCGIVRLTLDEEAPLHPRFRLREGDAVLKDLRQDEVRIEGEDAGVTRIVSSSSGDCAVVLTHEPFDVRVYAGGRVVQRLNARNLLNFERYRLKGASSRSFVVDATDVDKGDLFEERFGDFMDSKPRGPAAVGLDVTFAKAQVLVGLAEHAMKLHLSSNIAEPYRLYNLDVFEYAVDVPMSIYGNVPLITAVHHWPSGDNGTAGEPTASGFLVVNPSEGFVKPDKAVDEGTPTWWLFESGVLDMFSFAGPTPEAVLQQYHSVTGMPRMPPLFSFGKHQSRWNYIDTDDVIEVDKNFDEHSIPYDVIWLDLEHTNGKRYFTWHPKHFSDATRMLDHIGQSKRKLVTIIDPHLYSDHNYTAFSRMRGGGHMVRFRNGSNFEGNCWPGASQYPDFCNSEVQASWAKLFLPRVYPLQSRPELFTWNDMNEPSVFDGPEITMHKDNLHKCYSNNFDVEHRDVHNAYGMYVHEATVKGQLLVRPELRPFVLTRSFFVGSHRHGPLWTGDNTANWEHLARSVPMLVSLALCGLSLAGADVGGFLGDPELELLLRWHQLGIWYPFYRAHAHLSTQRREPWLFGEEAAGVIRDAVNARYALLPMWYTLAMEWSTFGLPMLRPIWYHDLGDVKAYDHADNEFLVGDAFVVRAVPRPGVKWQEVYLPSGKWFDYWDPVKVLRTGGQAFKEKLHSARLPVYVRHGRIIAKKMRPRRSSEITLKDPYTIVAYGSPAAGRVYADDGNTHAFQKGACIYEELTFDGGVLRSRAITAPSASQSERWPRGLAEPGAGGAAPGIPRSGLRIERMVFLALPRQPKSARVLEAGGGVRELSASVKEAPRGPEGAKLWWATLKDPAVHLGDHDWQVELVF